MAKITDQFPNLANVEAQESAANTITFAEITTGAGIFEKMAMVVHRMEYVLSAASVGLLQANDDLIEVGLVTSNQITGLAKDKAQVIDRIRFGYRAFGTPANALITEMPVVHDFTNLPGKGLIVPAQSLYIAIVGTSLASASYARVAMYFTYRELKGEEFWELVEATRALT